MRSKKCWHVNLLKSLIHKCQTWTCAEGMDVMQGGKVDDLTIVVAYVDEETVPREQPAAEAPAAT